MESDRCDIAIPKLVGQLAVQEGFRKSLEPFSVHPPSLFLGDPSRGTEHDKCNCTMVNRRMKEILVCLLGAFSLPASDLQDDIIVSVGNSSISLFLMSRWGMGCG